MLNLYDKLAFGSAIYMILVSFTAIVANGLLLVVFFFDPFKTFKNATTYFLIGLAFADLLGAATQEPLDATCYIMMYLGQPDAVSTCLSLSEVTKILALCFVDASFLIVLAFTVTQYIVVSSPLKHARKVTKKRVAICVLVIYVHCILISLLLHLMGVSKDSLQAVGLFPFSAFLYLNIAVYILLHIAFKRKIMASKNLREDKVQTGVQRRFISVNFLFIAILFFCIQPYVLLAIVKLYFLNDPNSPKVLIIFLMVKNTLYLKFLLDPFIFAWRIPQYRQALKIVLRCGREEAETKSTFGDRVVARMSKSRETVVTLDFKSTSQQ